MYSRVEFIRKINYISTNLECIFVPAKIRVLILNIVGEFEKVTIAAESKETLGFPCTTFHENASWI